MAPSNMEEWETGFSLTADLIKCGVANITGPIKEVNKDHEDGHIRIWGAKGVALVHMVSSEINLIELEYESTQYWITKTSLQHSRRLQYHSPLWKPKDSDEFGEFVTVCGCSPEALAADYPNPSLTLMDDICRPSRPSDLKVISQLKEDNHDLRTKIQDYESQNRKLRDENLKLEKTVRTRNSTIHQLKQAQTQNRASVRDITGKLSSLGKRARDLADDVDQEHARAS